MRAFVQPAEVLDARKSAGLTQAQAAGLVHLSSGLRWSEYERGERSPDPARWELFLLLTNQHPRLRVVSATFAEALQSPLVLLDCSVSHAHHSGGSPARLLPRPERVADPHSVR